MQWRGDDTKEASKDTAERTTKPGAKDRKPGDEDDEIRTGPIEYAGKNDYQFAQAVNLLKALQIIKR